MKQRLDFHKLYYNLDKILFFIFYHFYGNGVSLVTF